MRGAIERHCSIVVVCVDDVGVGMLVLNASDLGAKQMIVVEGKFVEPNEAPSFRVIICFV